MVCFAQLPLEACGNGNYRQANEINLFFFMYVSMYLFFFILQRYKMSWSYTLLCIEVSQNSLEAWWIEQQRKVTEITFLRVWTRNFYVILQKNSDDFDFFSFSTDMKLRPLEISQVKTWEKMLQGTEEYTLIKDMRSGKPSFPLFIEVNSHTSPVSAPLPTWGIILPWLVQKLHPEPKKPTWQSLEWKHYWSILIITD